jgi:hypothetical protein
MMVGMKVVLMDNYSSGKRHGKTQKLQRGRTPRFASGNHLSFAAVSGITSLKTVAVSERRSAVLFRVAAA